MKRVCCIYITPIKSYFNESERELLHQKGSCFSFAAQKHWSIARELKGIDLVTRHGMCDISNALKEEIFNNKFDVLLMYSFRLIDDYDTVQFIADKLSKRHIDLWSVLEGRGGIEEVTLFTATN